MKEYIAEWRKQRAKEEEELKRLKEKQAKRKVGNYLRIENFRFKVSSTWKFSFKNIFLLNSGYCSIIVGREFCCSVARICRLVNKNSNNWATVKFEISKFWGKFKSSKFAGKKILKSRKLLKKILEPKIKRKNFYRDENFQKKIPGKHKMLSKNFGAKNLRKKKFESRILQGKKI